MSCIEGCYEGDGGVLDVRGRLGQKATEGHGDQAPYSASNYTTPGPTQQTSLIWVIANVHHPKISLWAILYLVNEIRATYIAIIDEHRVISRS